MSDEKAPDLDRELSVVQTLYKRTRAGKVDWQVSDAYRGAFQADFGAVLVVIRESADEEYPDQPDYTLLVIQKRPDSVIGNIIFNNQMVNSEPLGRVIETISNQTLRPVGDRTTDEGLTPYNLLTQTFKLAKRKALKVDAILDNLLQQLGE